MSRSRRRMIMVDEHVQGALMARIIAYWLLCMFSILGMAFCWEFVFQPPRPVWLVFKKLLITLGPGLIGSLLLLPLALVDIVRLSSRFVSPIYRLKGAMDRISAGEPALPVRFRDDDYWAPVAVAFNEVVERLHVNEEASRTDNMTDSRESSMA